MKDGDLRFKIYLFYYALTAFPMIWKLLLCSLSLNAAGTPSRGPACAPKCQESLGWPSALTLGCYSRGVPELRRAGGRTGLLLQGTWSRVGRWPPLLRQQEVCPRGTDWT